MPGPSFLSSSPVVKADIDRSTLLCFACSSSLPPPKKSPGLSKSIPSLSSVFTTPCCQRLICNRCITTNPRLQRYNPCLACLGGVGVVGSPTPDLSLGPGACSNLDGAVRDENTFVLGDEDDSDYEDEKEGDPTLVSNADTSLFTQNTPRANIQGSLQERPTMLRTEEEGTRPDTLESSPLKYYITQTDTLQGIVLRFGLDGHEVCRLNNLPPSTLKTTPHLLHTRRYLILPPYKAGLPVAKESPEQMAAREAEWGKERAEKRLQTLMKETDWYVAKAYVALADDPVEEIEEQEEWERKRKEYGNDVGAGSSNLEERAIRKYLDDDEWEAAQHEGGAKPCGKGGILKSWW
ncbi:hypothetical protein C0995_001085 [Termitomyces sp. Mi166|nr:hypothetical protein C0995_001085 [Termitomyces sp. Mi166\